MNNLYNEIEKLKKKQHTLSLIQLAEEKLSQLHKTLSVNSYFDYTNIIITKQIEAKNEAIKRLWNYYTRIKSN